MADEKDDPRFYGNIFSLTCDAGMQQKFGRMLKDGELEEAVKVLDGLPCGQTREEKVARLIVQNEGYRGVIKAYEEGDYKASATLKEIQKIDELLRGI